MQYANCPTCDGKGGSMVASKEPLVYLGLHKGLTWIKCPDCKGSGKSPIAFGKRK